ncbi:MAG: hypothetical protein ABI761_12170 [Saprospiraceae bacterium]
MPGRIEVICNTLAQTMNGRITILFFIFFLYNYTSISQDIFIGGGMTLSTYFGDLSPQRLKQSSAEILPGVGVYGAKRIFNRFYIELEFERSTISGDDKKQAEESRKLRNLSFKTPITSISTQLSCRLPLFKQDKAGISGGAGFAVFTFDPKASIDGQVVRLQPLGTEGQGLDGSNTTFYHLIQSAKVIQLGAFYKISSGVFLEIEISQYFTSTDFLDDVSGFYFDAEQIRQYRGDLAWRLADRHAEIDPGSPNYPAGTPRGNPTKNDQFAYFKIGLAWALQNNNHHSNSKVKCPWISTN